LNQCALQEAPTRSGRESWTDPRSTRIVTLQIATSPIGRACRPVIQIEGVGRC
jgi:hypothetical protein